MTERPEISADELQRRVIYSLLRPAVRLCRRFGIGLKEIREWVELVYYHELKDDGLTLQEAADAAGVSRRKVAQLSKRLKQNFFSPEQQAGLPRRIEFMLWAGPMTEGRIRQAFADLPEDEVDGALQQLIDEARVVVEGERTRTFSVPKSEFRLYANNWIARVDGLNNQLGTLVHTVVGRFFEEDDRAFQRTLDFRVLPRHFSELRELYEQVIFPRLAELDEQAKNEDESVSVGLSIGWAPDYDEDTT